MISNDGQMRAAIAEQAAEWFVANDEELLDEQQSAALVAWLKASPIHVEEFLRVAGVARDLGAACAHPAHSADALLARARAEDDGPVESRWRRLLAPLTDVPARRWQTATVAVAALGVASVALLLSWNRLPVAPLPAPEAVAALHYSTHHGEQQTYRLADNSVLHLNTDTDVTIRYSKTERLVLLASGEAAFEVTHEPARAFRVLAGPAQVVDLGTEFDVRREDHSAVVTVVEGRVAVAPASTLGTSGANGSQTQPQQPVELGAGQQLSVAEGAWPATPVAVDAQRTTAWLHRQISFDGQPLERVVAEFNRYAQKPVEIASPALRDLEISGVFSVDDSEAFIAFLRSLDGVQVEVTDTRIRVSQK
ncbi:MAG: FecR family protein [Steroidobacteraceae bacterium]